MTLTGHIVGGQIVLSDPLTLPDGAAVRVEVVVALPSEAIASDCDESQPTLRERLKRFLSHSVDLPPDAAVNHDYYLVHGLPDRNDPQ